MEKKTKKLQLRKETIAVLNGERMMRVVGGLGYCRPPYEMVDVDGIQECLIVATRAVCAGTEACGNEGAYWSLDGCEDSGIRLTIKKSCNYTNCDVPVTQKLTCLNNC